MEYYSHMYSYRLSIESVASFLIIGRDLFTNRMRRFRNRMRWV